MEKEFNFNKDQLLEQYDNWELKYAMAYGSWVFKQEGYSEEEKPMIDFVFWVEDSERWHAKNLENNGTDYSLIKYLWAKNLSKIQKVWTGIYYNPYVPFNDIEIKYWVIEVQDMISDLINWDTLYVAWRLQKPVEILSSTTEIDEAQKINLRTAVKVALLLLPEQFTQKELFEKISSLSYNWDCRNGKYENKNKIWNIVSKNLSAFQNLYWEIMNNLIPNDCVVRGAKNNKFEIQYKTPQYKPNALINKPESDWYIDALMNALNYWKIEIEDFEREIASIVGSSSKAQTIKGLFTAWISKSYRYVSEKRSKAKK